MSKVIEPPKIIRVGGWTAAVLGAAVFAASLGIFFYQKANEPILAAKEQVACSANQRVAINNYPGTELFSESLPHSTYEKLMGDNWRCSLICVPGYDNSKKASDQSNKDALEGYLEGKKIGENDINIVPTGKDFIDLYKLDYSDEIKGSLMAGTVILSQTKSKCEGATEGSTSGGSVDYDKITTSNGDEVTPVEENDRQVTAAPPEEGFDISNLTGRGDGSPTGEEDGVAEIDITDFEDCAKEYSAKLTKANRDMLSGKASEKAIDKDVLDNVLQGEKNYSAWLKLIKDGKRINNKLLTQEWVDIQSDNCNGQLQWLKTKFGETETPQSRQPYNGDFKIFFSGYMKFSPNLLSISNTPTVLCAILSPHEKNSKNNAKCAASQKDGSFNLGPLKINEENNYKNINIFAVNPGNLFYFLRSSFITFSIPVDLTPAQIAKKSVTIKMGNSKNKLYLGANIGERNATYYPTINYDTYTLDLGQPEVDSAENILESWLENSQGWNCLNPSSRPI